jgi:hypothetical protein
MDAVFFLVAAFSLAFTFSPSSTQAFLGVLHMEVHEHEKQIKKSGCRVQ